MIVANTATYDVRNRETPLAKTAAIATRAATGRPQPSGNRAYSLYCLGHSAPPFLDAASNRQVREEGEYYIPDLLSDEGYEADPELAAAADAQTEGLREAQVLLDEAVNLVAVLMASTGELGDGRAMQADTVLRIVEKKLNKAHTRIDRHETRHRNLFLAYFELKESSGKGAP